MKKLLPLLLLLAPATLRAEDSASTSIMENLRDKSYVRFSLMSSRAGQDTDYRALKTSGSDDTGGMSEKTILPNYSFVSGFAMLHPSENQQLLFVMLQSIDSEDKRRVNTPFMPNFLLPGQIAVARYRYSLTENLGISLSGVHIDVFGYSDPSLGLNYHARGENGWSYKGTLLSSIPVTDRSRNEDLYTKSTARIGTTFRNGGFVTNSVLAHTRAFYKDPSILDRSRSHSPPPSSAGGPPPKMPAIPEVDIILSQKEKTRSTAQVESSYMVSRKVRLNAAAGASYVSTFKEKSFWITRLTPVGVSYLHKGWEAGADFALQSDVQKYRSPSLPNLWTVSMSLSYAFGEPPRS